MEFINYVGYALDKSLKQTPKLGALLKSSSLLLFKIRVRSAESRKSYMHHFANWKGGNS